jgi:crossover junction endodeoxyribonuclease RuvC
MRYVGIDPSTKTGIVVLDDEREYTQEITSKLETDPDRFMDIAEQVIDWLSDRKNEVICIEGFSYGSKGKGVSTQYGIGWLIRAELIRNGYTYTEVSPKSLKKFVTGNGNTKKDNMVIPIYKKWGFESPSDNVRDAYVLSQIAKALNDEEGLTGYQKDVIEKVKG